MSTESLLVHPVAVRLRGRRRRRLLLPLALLALVVATVLIGASLGPSDTGPGRTAVILAEPLRPALEVLGISLPHVGAGPASLVWSIRLPRVLLALVVGAGLGAAGLSMQAVFRNPLADPGVTGVSSRSRTRSSRRPGVIYDRAAGG